MPDTMKRFVEPRSVAIIGVSRATGLGAFNILENMINAGFSGRVYPVNPNADEIMGIKAYPSVLDIADDIDLAVISTPRTVVPGIVRECTQRGIKAITIVGQGFADGDEEGRQMQDEIVRVARKGGTRILGPNTFGTANAFNNFSSAFIPMIMKRIPIGFISQTGFYFPGLPNFTVVGKGIDLGNTCDIGFADGLEYFEDDPDIRLILLHIEGISDGRRFMEVAERVARKKPVLALKTGRGEEGARAAQSHTGALVGRDEVYDAAFRQCGVIRITDLDEFEDLAKAFLNLPLMTGRGVAVITVTGAVGIMAIDYLEKHHLRLASLSTTTLDRINALAPSWQWMDNPADIWPAAMIAGHPFDEVFTTVLDSFLKDEDVHAVLLIFAGFFDIAMAEPAAGMLDIVERAGAKPVVWWLYGPEVEPLKAVLEKTGRMAVFPTVDRALRALSRLNARWEFLTADEGKD